MTRYLFKSVIILPSTIPTRPLLACPPPEWVKAGKAEEAQGSRSHHPSIDLSGRSPLSPLSTLLSGFLSMHYTNPQDVLWLLGRRLCAVSSTRA
jgi:hypothetical protein